ncbi:hypothetical protein LZ683_16500 [Comamonas testosteroni]|uniref:hypothetical protein n=1 Tax=Comamonas testosteroni TaxID=285 RepID=UPI0023AA48FC|nr:hypothetical protein [Comamonas testosteroni]WEE75758.1 hypothetical protein LZ683_16500 [Comamonas testosteroni]
MRVTLRERLSGVADGFATLEVALFTSFNFHADFFEQNVLSALFGVEVGVTRAAREQLVHRGLRHTQVGVFYDPSAAKPGAKSFRYTAYPVFVPGRLFHPKLILLFGRDHGGVAWIYIAAMSANLSLSGWGRNCEGFADTWVHARSEQPAQVVRELLTWLRENSVRGGRRDPLARAITWGDELQDRRSRADPEGNGWRDKIQTRLYFAPSHDSLWQFLRTQYGAISNVRAASPYWGGAEAIAKELAGVPLCLTAAHRPPQMAVVGIGQATVNVLMPDVSKRPEALSAWKNDKARFRHLKLYEVATARAGVVTGIGSCNFTVAGQFWKSGARKPDGNVEAMLFDTTTCDWDTQPLALAGLPEADADDSPQPWPFHVAVEYDWKARCHAWHTEGELGAATVTLNLHDGGTVLRLSDSAASGKRQDSRFSHRFTVTRVDPVDGEAEVFEGIVSETNLDDSTQIYGTPLTIEEILDSWKSGADAEPLRRHPSGEDEDDDTEDDTATQDADATAETQPFDSFALYQSLRKLRAKLDATADSSLRETVDWLVGRSDSVLALARAFSDGRHSPSAAWIVLSECEAILRPAARHAQVVAGLKAVREALARTRPLVIAQVREQLAQRHIRVDYAESMLDWYQRQMRGSMR